MANKYGITKENLEKVMKLDGEIARLTAERELYISAWKEQLESEGVLKKELKNGMAVIGWEITYQNRFNQKKFGTDYPELLNQYKEKSERKTFKY